MNPFPARRRVHPTSCGETLLNLGTSSLLPVWLDRSLGGAILTTVMRYVHFRLTTTGRLAGCDAKRTRQQLVGRLRHLRYLRPTGAKKIRNMHHVRRPALEPR